MIKVCFYNKITGFIFKRYCTDSYRNIFLQYNADSEEFYLNCPTCATHIIDNEPVAVLPPPPTTEELLGRVRHERGIRLGSSDWTQTLDVPLSPEKKAEWAAYRQALRDFPETCDPDNPVWPVAPDASNVIA